ncbi:hypothetical protein [Flavobacterium hercynium]|uniref:Erythromycin esterase n=1 Tax=Flavobacterium hercynium TaxID=387094 RepID=A0A226GYG3_9FLAO|nr:hypothetical protein [Flavobacterium hercynium]OXA86608.1 hypothetical protein B0A66_17565 [Flavobacterium hercynium]SMP25359.1 hypothetical protein SAMN06265346_108241 [Flavobacterium hercynium]
MKKILKILKFTFISLLSIILIFLIYLYISNKVFLGSTDQGNLDYLAKNNVPVTTLIDGKLFDEDFYKSKVFLLGEIHGYADNQTLDREMLFFLNKKAGIKYYIAEMDSITATKLNSFLLKKSKDEVILKDVVVSIAQRIPQQSSQQLFDKWNAIYDYNQKLADSLKITVLGIDKNFDDTSKGSRDLAMISNFKNLIKKRKIENEKFYGLFGYFHTLQSQAESGRETFAAELKKSGIKTTSIVSYTIDSEMYLPKNPQFPTPENERVDWLNADGPFMLVKGINDLKELSAPKAVTLFKLNASNSPYLKSKNLISLKSRMFGENIVPLDNLFVTDYFQYVFVLRNSEALSKLK